MSSRSRTVSRPASVVPFDWGAAPGREARQPIPTPATADDPRELPAACAPDGAPAPPDHEARFAALERDAFATGFAQGERAGAEAAAQRGEAMLRRLAESLEDLTTVRAQLIRQTERQMVQLALAVARRVIHREVSLDQDLLIAMARVALDRLGETAQVLIRLHPEDFAATAAARQIEWAGSSIQMVADSAIARGGCRIESEFGTIEAGVDAQIQELARALLGEAEEMTNAASR